MEKKTEHGTKSISVMKSRLFICLSAIIALTSCQEELMPQQKPVADRVPSEFHGTIEEMDATKTYLDEFNNVRWAIGDQITIFAGNTLAERYQVTDDSHGKTSADFDYIRSSSFAGGSDITNNIAFYPYSGDIDCAYGDSNSPVESYVLTGVVLPSVQEYAADSFGPGAAPMVAVTGSADEYGLKFRNICGGLKLQVLGNDRIASVRLTGNGGEVLCGPAEIKAFVDYSVPSITMTGDDTEVTLDCGEGVQLNMDEATSFIISLPPMEFAEGFTVELTDVDGGKMTVSASVANTITRSSLLRMPAITYVSDLSAKGTANSYIVSQKGAYKIRTVKGNSDESVGEAASAEVLWESFGTDVIPNVGDLVKDAEYSDGYISFKTADTFKEGNAVIAAKDEAGNILWSWHIWLVEDEIKEHEYAFGAGTLMDRNLGATSAVPGEIEAFGLLYQWGRKDPFLGSSSKSDNPNYTGAIALSTIVWPDYYKTEGEDVLDLSIASPIQFITNWPEDKELETLWNKKKTIYDPCPPGWTVATESSIKGSGIEMSDFIYDHINRGLLINHNGNEIWYPSTGLKDFNTEYDGKLLYVGGDTRIWMADAFTTDRFSINLYYYPEQENIGYYPDPQCQGFSVRCLKENSSVPAATLSPAETANSYIIPEKGVYSFPAVKGNSDESVGEVASAEVLWESFGTDTEPSEGDLVKNVKFEDGNIVFNTNTEYKEGNAVVAAKDAEGTILWSWHLWFVEDEIVEHEYANNAGTLMDRNLGATSAVPGEIRAYGLRYQWGRKDPFVFTGNHTSDFPYVQSDNTTGTVEYAQKNPTTVIEGELQHYWIYSDGSTDISEYDKLWASVKTEYDPCPAGWRVPDGGENGIWAKAGFPESYPYDSDRRGKLFSHMICGQDAWYPYDGDEDLWSVTNSGNHVWFFEFYDSDYTSPLASYAAKGRLYAVRCYKIGSGTLQTDQGATLQPPCL